MQTLRKRTKKNTPTDISQVRSNCGLPLKEGRSADGVADSKTFFNNPDATLTASEEAGQNLRVSVVFVRNMRGKPLMPCSPREAKKLLKLGEAKVVARTPFTIQLLKQTGETKQKIKAGEDSGYKYIGLAAVGEKQEFFSAELELRTDMVKLNSERSQYRKSRRGRNTRYRPARFLNRKKIEGWLVPSIQHKVDSHVKILEWLGKFLPITETTIEIAPFDIQKIKNPEIEGEEYQQGEQFCFDNVREFVLYRDGHECQHCFGKSGDKKLQVHHKYSRQISGNKPEDLVTVCKTCHHDHHTGKIEFNFKPAKNFKAETFMNLVREKVVERVQEKFQDMNVNVTFGHITKHNRVDLGLSKSHANDAFVIAGGKNQQRSQEYEMKQVRRSNRKLRKGAHSQTANTAPRFVKGFQRYDKVNYQGEECFVFGRRRNGFFDIRTLAGIKISVSTSYKKIKLVESFRTLLIQMKAKISDSVVS